MYGTTGNILRVNLTSGSINKNNLSEGTVKKFLGGKCLGAKILYEELPPKIDPYSSENKIVFAAGPLTGAPFPGNSRYVVMAKSPITYGWGESHAAGFFGPELKYAGYDSIIIEGKSESPVYLSIRNEEVEIKDAKAIWGEPVGATEARIRKEAADNRTRVAAIGPGGERRVRFASIISDLHCAAGRCGMGAVMGSKNLKAIAVRGTHNIPIHNQHAFYKMLKEINQETMAGWGQPLFDNGTAKDMEPLSIMGRLPTKNFRKCIFDNAPKISGDTLTKTIMKKRLTCPSCPIAHYRSVETEGLYRTDPSYGGPEYETCAAFGSLCMNSNLEVIAKANELCNKYGIDTIATGAAIAFLMECYEKRVITKDDTDGVELKWGDEKAIITMIHKIAKKEGIGTLLAEGVKRASEKLGKGSERWALHIKGAELPMHEPRTKKGLGLTYATSDRGASHLQVYHDDSFMSKKNVAPEIGIDSTLVPQNLTETGPRKVKLVKISEDLMGLYNSLVICRFVFYPAGVSVRNLLRLFRSITGWEASPGDLLRVGERSFNITRAFNAREGFTRKDDVLPKRVMEPLDEGGFKGEGFPGDVLEDMLNLYYHYRGWDLTNGWPEKWKLEELKLEKVVHDLHPN